MPEKITWWPFKQAKFILHPAIVLMRYDWPDGERIYQLGLYDPFKVNPWTDGNGEGLQTPDFFTPADQIVEFIQIPPEREYTYTARKVSH